jgi:hypothetical protein
VKFFVPYACDEDHAEQIWNSARADLSGLGYFTTRRRIWALSLDDRNPVCLLHIGRQIPDEYGPAMAIFEASDSPLYYVCTPYNGILGGEPFSLKLSERGRAIDFDEVVEGNA